MDHLQLAVDFARREAEHLARLGVVDETAEPEASCGRLLGGPGTPSSCDLEEHLGAGEKPEHLGW